MQLDRLPNDRLTERLLILDLHLEWSAGGPVYDFVANSGETAIRNHMAAFQTVMEHTDRRLESTVIRIPLRTEAQARQSDTSDKTITVSKYWRSCKYSRPSLGITDYSLCGM